MLKSYKAEYSALYGPTRRNSMNHISNRISALVMAFTLLGAGTAITQNIAPQLCNNSITAHAAVVDKTKDFELFASFKPTKVQLQERSLKVGICSKSVIWLKVALNHLMNAGLKTGSLYDKKTEAAVREFQKAYRMKVNGIFGVKELDVMNRILRHIPVGVKKQCVICGHICDDGKRPFFKDEECK